MQYSPHKRRQKCKKKMIFPRFPARPDSTVLPCVKNTADFGSHLACLSADDDCGPRARRARHAGFTLLEILVSVAILGVLISIVMVAYNGYIETTRVASAIKQINAMSIVINDYQSNTGEFPASLSDAGLGNMQDPWGRAYQYLNIAAAKNIGKVRKDHNLVPLNTDYDLYSMGKDGQSKPPLTAKASQDDIVRANNGGFVGMASNY